MARRSPLNPRYQKNTQPAGKTRRSASAAKPKREAGGAAPAEKKKAAARPSFREALAAQPSTPEMKKWRRVWIALIIAAIMPVGLTWLIPGLRSNQPVQMLAFLFYVLCFGAAIYIDAVIIRRLRKQATEEAKKSEKKR